MIFSGMSDIKETLSSLFPDDKYRKRCLSLFAESIVEAHSHGGNMWGVYCFREGVRKGIRLLVGSLIVFTIDEDGMWLSLDKALLNEKTDERRELDTSDLWRWGRGEYSEYRAVPSRNGYYAPSSTDFDLWPVLREFHFAYLRNVAQKYGQLRLDSQENHTPAVMVYLREELKQNLPSPDYGAAPGDNPFLDVEDLSRTYRELPETERRSIVLSRIGQGSFRSDLEKYWKTCAVTGCAKPELLVASHIKPWRDSDNFERLDVYNGLLLAPHLDRAFDRGYVSFDDEGRIILSTVFSNRDQRMLGIRSDMKLRKIEPNHFNYLDYHRKNVLKR
jgi:putative restriction endonuclease